MPWFLCVYIDGHMGCFYILDVVEGIAWLQISLQCAHFCAFEKESKISGLKLSSGMVRSCNNCVWSVCDLHAAFPVGFMSLHAHQQCAGFILLPSMWPLFFSDSNSFNKWGLSSPCSLDLHLSSRGLMHEKPPVFGSVLHIFLSAHSGFVWAPFFLAVGLDALCSLHIISLA